LALAMLACGPRSNDVNRFEALEDDGTLTGAGGSTGSFGATTTGAGAADDSSVGSGSSPHTGAGGATSGTGPTTTSSGSGGNTGGACCAPVNTPGCSDSALEACVCATDDWCCNNEWDAICVWHAQDSCQACANAPCSDIGGGEPNNGEANAFQLTTQAISDCNSAGGTFWGTINGPTDVDWYIYEGSDTFSCVVDPTRSASALEAPVRMCKFFECKSGQANITCPSGTTAETSPDGRNGCCGTTGFSVDLDCTGTSSDDAFVFVRIDQPGAPSGTCNHYSSTYHY
jgi:hypothetical protein